MVELLAALLLSALVVVAASRIFLSGNFQFLKRFSESERLGTLYRLKGAVDNALRKDVERCAADGLWIREGDSTRALIVVLKGRFPDLAGAEFRCLELSPDGTSLVEWKERFQPGLVEYRVVLKKKGIADTLNGSWIP